MILIAKKDDTIEVPNFDFKHQIMTISEIIKDKKDLSQYTYIIVLGGDGSLLRAIHFTKDVPKVFAFNFGTLGYLTTFGKEDIHNITRIIDGSYCFVRKRLCLNDGTYFLNEVVLTTKRHRLNTFTLKMLGREIRLSGDALIVSTPSGSTGYNHSLGGPTLLCDSIAINLVAPSKCNFRPLVVGINTVIEIEVHCEDGLMIIDGLEKETNYTKITFDGNEITFGCSEDDDMKMSMLKYKLV